MDCTRSTIVKFILSDYLKLMHTSNNVINNLKVNLFRNERKSEQAHIPHVHAPTLLENAVYNKW